jgi:hypothetical protein
VLLATSVEGRFLVQKVRSNRARALHHSNEMQLFCEKQHQLGGEWLVVLLTHAHCRSDMRFWGDRCMPSSPSRPPLIRIYLLQELTLTVVTKLGARGATWLFAGAQIGYPPTICWGLGPVADVTPRQHAREGVLHDELHR